MTDAERLQRFIDAIPRELRRYHKDASWCVVGMPCRRAHDLRTLRHERAVLAAMGHGGGVQ